MHIESYLEMVYDSEKELSEAFMKVAKHHQSEPDIYFTCQLLSSWSKEQSEKIMAQEKRYAKFVRKSKEPERLRQTLFKEPRKGSLAMIRDLQDLWLLTKEVEIGCSILLQAAAALRDMELKETCENLDQMNKRQSEWLETRIKQAAPEILVVAE
jgi:hypothetical protein